MDSLGNIIENVLDGEEPDYDDLRYAICAMSSLMTFDRIAFHALARAEKDNKKRILSFSAVFQSDERFNRVKRAFSKAPKEWLGKNNDPDSIEVQKRRKFHSEIVEKIIDKIIT